MTDILIEEDITSGSNSLGGWVVLVHNNDTNTVEEVIKILMRATNCSKEEAYTETWEIHNLGKSVVHSASEEECKKVADVISSIGIKTDVYQE